MHISIAIFECRNLPLHNEKKPTAFVVCREKNLGEHFSTKTVKHDVNPVFGTVFTPRWRISATQAVIAFEVYHKNKLFKNDLIASTEFSLTSERFEIDHPKTITLPLTVHSKHASDNGKSELIIQITPGDFGLQPPPYVWTWGKGKCIGHGDFTDRSTPEIIFGLQKIKDVLGSARSSYFIGEVMVYTCGSTSTNTITSDTLNKIVTEDTTIDQTQRNKYVPHTLVTGSANQIAAGANHALILMESRHVLSIGGNDQGQLGQGDTFERVTPQVIDFFSNLHVVKVFAGPNASFVCLADGSVYYFGLGVVSPTKIDEISNVTNMCVTETLAIALTCTGEVNVGTLVQGQFSWEPLLELTDKDVVDVECGEYAYYALTKSGMVYCWGKNVDGCLGLGEDVTEVQVPTLIPSLRSVTQLSSGKSHVLALCDNGQLFSFGNNASGQLGTGDLFNSALPCLIPAMEKNNVTKISCGYHHSIAISQSGIQ
ncbi:hypothetical protein AKO1_014961 [Acrasis kona]|uniref:C2 domain-containing protein n=1 Tax=Acrasis kona TaxID=1008807 RepID=A0AAW2Z013_9EUKA